MCVCAYGNRCKCNRYAFWVNAFHLFRETVVKSSEKQQMVNGKWLTCVFQPAQKLNMLTFVYDVTSWTTVCAAWYTMYVTLNKNPGVFSFTFLPHYLDKNEKNVRRFYECLNFILVSIFIVTLLQAFKNTATNPFLNIHVTTWKSFCNPVWLFLFAPRTFNVIATQSIVIIFVCLIWIRREIVHVFTVFTCVCGHSQL